MENIPDYVHEFIRERKDKLNEIYEGRKSVDGSGYLHIKINVKENKIDVIYIDEILKRQMLTKEFCENIETNNKEDKKIYLVEDLKLNSLFILYI
jgi:hypothetical protein